MRVCAGVEGGWAVGDVVVKNGCFAKVRFVWTHGGVLHAFVGKIGSIGVG